MSSVVLAALLAATPPAPGDSGGPEDTADVGVVERQEDDPTVFPDPGKFSRGFFVEGATGPLVPLGATTEVLSPGFSATVRTGYEIRRWVALQGHVSGSMSKYDDGVLGGEILQQYVYTGEARFGIPIRRFLVAVQGGAGAMQLDSNLLQNAGIAPDNRRFFFAWDASVAFDVHSLSRHFSGGLVATFVGVPQLQNAGSLAVQLYLRYTF